MKIARLVGASFLLLLLASSGRAFAADGDETPPASGSTPSTGAATPTAPSEGPAESGLSLGVRIGFGLPLGDAAEGAKLSDGVTGSVPFIFDIGYRGLGVPNLYLGAFGTWGPAFYKDCPSGASCSSSVVRLGINARWHFLPQESLDPYAGLGFGYEFLNFSAEANGREANGSYKGFEFVEFQGGLDFKATPAFRVGPFVNLAMGQYSTAEITSSTGTSVSGDITKTALHMWLIFGARGQFDL